VNVRSKYIMIVLLSALIVAFETVAIEGALNIADLNLYLVSSLPSIVGGCILMGIYPGDTKAFVRSLDRRGWSLTIVMCILAAFGVILWFDAVSRIGASKEAILGGGSSEVLFVVILSALFLKEKLTRLEGFGSLLIVLGVFLVLADLETLSFPTGIGEMEAIASSLSLAGSIIISTALLRVYKLTPVSGVELFLSGIMVVGFGIASGLVSVPDAIGWVLLVLLGLFPAVGLLTYNSGLPKIGASLTSVLFALTGIMTVGVQLLVLALYPDAEIILPRSVAVAVLGGVVAFVGVYLLHKKKAALVSIEAGG
jgi:drug/metabolite transporter (DMT)-like permease